MRLRSGLLVRLLESFEGEFVEGEFLEQIIHNIV